MLFILDITPGHQINLQYKHVHVGSTHHVGPDLVHLCRWVYCSLFCERFYVGTTLWYNSGQFIGLICASGISSVLYRGVPLRELRCN